MKYKGLPLPLAFNFSITLDEGLSNAQINIIKERCKEGVIEALDLWTIPPCISLKTYDMGVKDNIYSQRFILEFKDT